MYLLKHVDALYVQHITNKCTIYVILICILKKSYMFRYHNASSSGSSIIPSLFPEDDALRYSNMQEFLNIQINIKYLVHLL
jgi:hypothetical protein